MNLTWLLLIDILLNIQWLSGLFVLILAIRWLIIVISVADENFDVDEDAENRKIRNKYNILIIVCLIIFAFIPTKETMLTVGVAQYLTEENISIGVEGIQDTIDYIFEKIEDTQQ